jgi:hypothetical protein
MKKPNIKTLRNKCDKLLQELVRATYDRCLVCGKPVSCGHHYYPKSTSSALRYCWENIIPICQGCHFSLHNSNPEIQNRINTLKGKKWLADLQKKKSAYVKTDVAYYKSMYEKLKLTQ